MSGRVQGVSFRASAVEVAQRLELRGWISNTTDGSVEGVIEGDDANVESFLVWCEAGPALARVTGLDRSEDASTEALPAFQIRR